MQRLKNKLNLMASIVMIYMVIKKKIGNGTQVSRTISKHANT
jgi:hypothetical protein